MRAGDPADEVAVNEKTPLNLEDSSNRNAAVRGSANPAFSVGKSVGMDDRERAVDGAEQVAPLSAQNTPKLNAQPHFANPSGSTIYERSKWKRSRIKKGRLIKRLTGYSIAESEYGLSYLWVLSRKPDRTSADNSVWPLAGYFNWKSLEASGLLRKEKKRK